MHVFDTSSMIYAWDNYPERQFPSLWNWIAKQIEQGNLVMSVVAFDEVKKNDPDCYAWLSERGLNPLETSNSIIQDARRIKDLIGIVADNYHGNGVGENDLFIIATARAYGAELVTDERPQAILPNEPRKRKIPAVCGMQEVNVSCINFVEYIKRSQVVFR